MPDARPPLVEPLGGSIDGSPLRPVSVRVGDDIRRVGDGVTGKPVLVYLEVDGVWVSLSFDAAR